MLVARIADYWLGPKFLMVKLVWKNGPKLHGYHFRPQIAITALESTISDPKNIKRDIQLGSQIR